MYCREYISHFYDRLYVITYFQVEPASAAVGAAASADCNFGTDFCQWQIVNMEFEEDFQIVDSVDRRELTKSRQGKILKYVFKEGFEHRGSRLIKRSSDQEESGDSQLWKRIEGGEGGSPLGHTRFEFC